MGTAPLCGTTLILFWGQSLETNLRLTVAITDKTSWRTGANVRKKGDYGQNQLGDRSKCPQEGRLRTELVGGQWEMSARRMITDKTSWRTVGNVRKKDDYGQNQLEDSGKCPQEG
jgi:hypothetical protein